MQLAWIFPGAGNITKDAIAADCPDGKFQKYTPLCIYARNNNL